ncbi:MAG: peptidylprolyl isomerase [Candidatus Marinimicrobia bacterium]|nr:peptidylprolyl isomerase [Candidatus Neomarinimicrobiota bacterium]
MISNKLNTLIFVCFMANAPNLASQVIDGIAAVVGDEIILKSEVDQFAKTQALRMRIDPIRNPSRYESIWRRTLKTLVDQKILLDRAELDSIEISDREIEEALDNQIEGIIQRAGSREMVEELIGYSLNRLKRNYREEIRKQKLVDKVQQLKFSDMSVNRREVEEFFSEYSDSLPELKPAVKISHILKEVVAGPGADSIAYQKADSLLGLLKTGSDFDEIAMKYSDDTNSAVNGGELGFMKRGTLVPEFEEASYSLLPGSISKIVKTEFGYHVIKMIERRGDKINVKHVLIMAKTSTSDEDRVISLLNDIIEKINSGDQFEKMALEHSDDPEVKLNNGDLGWLDLASLNIPQFAFVLDTLQVGNISAPFKTDFGYHIIKKIDYREGGPLSLENNWHEIESMVVRNKRLKVYNEWLNSIRNEVYIDIKM